MDSVSTEKSDKYYEASSNTNISDNNNYNNNNSNSKLNNNSRIFSRIDDGNDKLYNGSDSSNIDMDLSNSIKSVNNTTKTQNFSKLNIPVTNIANTVTSNTLYKNRTYGPYSPDNSSFSISNSTLHSNSIMVNQITAVEPNLLQILNTTNNFINSNNDTEMKESDYNNANDIMKNNNDNDNNSIIHLEANKITIPTKLESLEKSNRALKINIMEL